MTASMTSSHHARLECRTCGVPITGGYVCRPDADRAVGILGELPGWATELDETSSGIRGQRAVDRRPTRVHPAGVVDEGRRELAEWLRDARASWIDAADADGWDLIAAGQYAVSGWSRGPAFVAAMVAAESRALGLLDPDESVLRDQRARQAQRAAAGTSPVGRPRGVPGAAALLRRARSVQQRGVSRTA